MRERKKPAAGPVVKFVGGKAKLLPELLSRMPATYGRYYEPFVGGGALFFALQPERAVLGDVNADLINVYQQVAQNAESICVELAGDRESHNEIYYYRSREVWNQDKANLTPLARAAMFLYLNRCCFNGLWRVNRAGKFNVPMGRYTDPLAGMADRIRAAAPVLARAELRTGDFAETLTDVEPGDLVYCDPPYHPLTPTANFRSYTSNGFTNEDQVRLAETVRALAARGVQVMASNSDTPFIRKLYAGMRIDSVECARAINSNGAKRGKVGEVIVTAGYEYARSAA